jgi:DNA-directed RNA polymerase sigma subunit (sigma70/sigma32)
VALTVLDDRARYIFEARRLMEPPLTLDELAEVCGIGTKKLADIAPRVRL